MASLLPRPVDIHGRAPSALGDAREPRRRRPVPQAVILAAGAGSRLRSCETDAPKPLMSVGGVSLLERAIRVYRGLGVSEVIVVVGFQREVLLPTLAELRVRLGMRITPVISSEWELGNGASVLAAERHVSQAFFLAMCDHIFEPAALERLVVADDGATACALVVDHNVFAVRDFEEATKVQLAGDAITAIGKQLTVYDAADTGVFLCRPALFDALHEAARSGRHTLSDAVQLLARRGQARAVDGTGLDWFDVDTAEDLQYADAMLGSVETLLTSGQPSVPPVATAAGGADVI